jgi:hypothetical protein
VQEADVDGKATGQHELKEVTDYQMCWSCNSRPCKIHRGFKLKSRCFMVHRQ